jgi:hypothetical protein
VLPVALLSRGRVVASMEADDEGGGGGIEGSLGYQAWLRVSARILQYATAVPKTRGAQATDPGLLLQSSTRLPSRLAEARTPNLEASKFCAWTVCVCGFTRTRQFDRLNHCKLRGCMSELCGGILTKVTWNGPIDTRKSYPQPFLGEVNRAGST